MMERQHRRYVGSSVLALGLVGLLAGCGSSTSSPATTSAPSTTAVKASNLAQFKNQLTTGKSLTYKATYALTSPKVNGTFVVERMPPSSNRFDITASGQQLAIIANPTATYICDLSKTPAQCVSGIPDPLASFEKLVDPAQIIPALQQAAAAGTKSVTFSTRNVAGMAATCASVTSGQAGTFCVSNQGVLVSVSASDGSITLTGYTTSVPASDFAPPAGAAVQAAPTAS